MWKNVDPVDDVLMIIDLAKEEDVRRIGKEVIAFHSAADAQALLCAKGIAFHLYFF